MALMSVKRGTQTFSAAEQSSGLKSDRVNTAGADEFAKIFGDQSVGDVANKIVDPNWVDPSKKLRTTGDNTLDKDAFLKLMLAQMKNQDPTNPMQSHEMAAQLAQFTSLEQLNNINTTLESMKSSQTPNANFQALAFIGKKVSGDSSKVVRSAGDTRHSFDFQLMGDAAKVKVSVKDGSGTTIRTLETANLKKGKNSVEWNGLMDDGLPARAGEYKFSVEAQASSGAKVWAKTNFEGRITGLNYGADGPVLMVGNQAIRMSDVKKIEEPGPEDFSLRDSSESRVAESQSAASPKINKASGSSVAATSVTGPGGSSDDDLAPAPEAEPEPTGNLDDVAMSREMLNKLAKFKK